MNKTSRLLALIVAIGAGLLALPLTATAGNSFNHNVTVQVDSVLDITYEDNPDILMEFKNDFATGALSAGKFINYKVRANNMTTGALSGAITAKISQLVDGVDVVTAAGSMQYTNEGTSSNAVLVPTGSNAAVVIRTSPVALFDKASGPAAPNGKILKGHAGVYYQAKALRDLNPSDGGTTILTVTLKDS